MFGSASSGYQIRAVRRNQLERHRLGQQITSLERDLQRRLAQLQRQSQRIQDHFNNVVQVVKPKPTESSFCRHYSPMDFSCS